MCLRRVVPILLAICLLPLTVSRAQFDKDYKSWYGHVAAGYSVLKGDTTDVADDGWVLNGGATYKPGNWPLGIIMDLGYSRYDVSDRVREETESSGGDWDIWSLTGGAIWAPTSGGKVGFYLSGSVGVYRLEGRLTEPGTGCGWVCDPFFPGWCWWTCGGVNVVTDKVSTTDFGGSIAAGLTFRVSSMGSTLNLECKYNYIDTDREGTQYIPITLGYRW